jgi:hypothetical protein
MQPKFANTTVFNTYEACKQYDGQVLTVLAADECAQHCKTDDNLQYHQLLGCEDTTC